MAVRTTRKKGSGDGNMPPDLNPEGSVALIKESGERLSRIVQGISIPTFAIDSNHIVTHCNRAFENLTGINAGEIVGTGKQWLAFYPARRPVLADLIVDGAPESEIARYYGASFRRSPVIEDAYEAEAFFSDAWKTGKWLFFTAAPLRDTEGRIVGAVETFQDISERKKTEEALSKSERRYRTLLNFLPHPVVLFTLEGRVSYLNAAFTETFGWTLEELRGKRIPYVPPDLEGETSESIKRLFKDKVILHQETRRLTRDGRILDVSIRATLYSETGKEPSGELIILRDITPEKRIARQKEAILRISTLLPEYPDLEELLEYVNSEVQSLLFTEGAVVILHDEEREELSILSASYEDTATQNRIKEIRFSMDQLVAGRVIKTGKPIIVNDTSGDPGLHEERDRRLGYRTRNLLLVPLRSIDRIIGVLCAINKKHGDFEEADLELLSTVAGTVALSIENARFSEEIKKALRNNEALLRISTTLPEYPDLEGLLDFVSGEVKRLLATEGALVILRNEEKDELFFLGVAYDDTVTQRRVKEIRFPMDQLVAGRVIRTGKPIILNDTSDDPNLHRKRDEKLGYKTRNLLLVPLRSSDRIIGVLCAINKKEGDFDQSNVDLLNMVSATVALSIENARFSEEIKRAYREVSSLNRAKDKVINHLSHELKTPVSILATNLKILTGKLENLPEAGWKPAMERARRNLERILEIQYIAHDIMRERHYKTRNLLSGIINQCADELETLIAEQVGEIPVLQRVREKVEEIFGSRDLIPEEIALKDFIEKRIEALRPAFSHRELEITGNLDPSPATYIPSEPLQKVIDGLLKNAVENTPDQGRIEILLRREGQGSLFLVRDYGVGIRKEAQKRIFDGFFTTQDTLDYSTKSPFDFNAGGKGADLLRMKIFSERYGFRIDMRSTRCSHIPAEKDACPGRISECSFCSGPGDCYASGGSVFSILFPPVPEAKQH